MDPALLTRLDALGEDLLGRKVRVAGQVLAYDAYTGLVLLRDRDAAVVVDVALCVSAWAADWVGEHLCTVTVLGYLERAPAGMRVPEGPRHVPAPRVDSKIIVRALQMVARAELDMALWNEAVGEGDDSSYGREGV
ncbi:hypothetical protein FB451DRAFT_1211422 [Mycena latifolia]|nr:hypothetical protein FB451DRAFT_1211422 [Mycena latifolia]